MYEYLENSSFEPFMECLSTFLYIGWLEILTCCKHLLMGIIKEVYLRIPEVLLEKTGWS